MPVTERNAVKKTTAGGGFARRYKQMAVIALTAMALSLTFAGFSPLLLATALAGAVVGYASVRFCALLRAALLARTARKVSMRATEAYMVAPAQATSPSAAGLSAVDPRETQSGMQDASVSTQIMFSAKAADWGPYADLQRPPAGVTIH